MSQPHHFVINALQSIIVKSVKIDTVIDHLVDKKVIPESDVSRYKGKKNGMKMLTFYLKNRSFETFLDFIECIFLVQQEVQSIPVVESMIKALQDFDKQSKTTHTERVVAIQKKYLKQFHETETAEVGQSLETSQVEARQESEHEELQSLLQVQEFLYDNPFSMPANLDYIEEPVQASFKSDGGKFTDLDAYGFSLIVPPLAVPKGQLVNVKVGLCCYGPFSIGANYLLASDFAVIVADREFEKPVRVVMEHALILPDYRKCSEVIILKASHQKVTEEGLYTFDRFTNPEISPDSPELSFEIESFCILCAVLDPGERDWSSSSSSLTSSVSHTSSHCHIDDDNPSSAVSSFDEDLHPLGVERSYSAESKPSGSGLDFTNVSPQKVYNFRKRKPSSLESTPVTVNQKTTRPKRASSKRFLESDQSCSTAEKKHCNVEYAVLLFESKKKIVNSENEYRFAVFVCINCGLAHEKVCEKQAEKMLKSEVELTSIPITIEKALKLETTIKGSGWSVEANRSPTVSLSEVQFHNMKRIDLAKRLEKRTCPPRILFTADCDEGAERKFSCKVTVTGATVTGTQEEVFFNVRASRSVIPSSAMPSGNLLRQNALDPHQYLPQSYHNQYPGYPPISNANRAAPSPNYDPHISPHQICNLENVSPNFPQHLKSPVYPSNSGGWSYPENFSQSSSHPGLSQAQDSDSPLVSQPYFSLPPQPHHQRSLESGEDSPQIQRLSLGHCSPSLSQGRNQTRSLERDHTLPELLRRGSSSEVWVIMNSSSDNEKDRASSLPGSYRRPPISHYEDQLNSEEKDTVITNKDYSKLIPHIRDWKRLAREGFGLTEESISHLEYDYRLFSECAFQAYHMWKTKSHPVPPSTLWTLLLKLHEAKEFAAIGSLIEKIEQDEMSQ